MSPSPTEAVFRAVLTLTASNRPVSTESIARHVQRSSSTISGLLHHLVNTGWVQKYPSERRNGRYMPVRWGVTTKGRTTPYTVGLPYLDTPQRILEVLGEDESLTIGELADRLERPYETVRRGCETLVRRKQLVRSIERYRAVFSRPLPDDDWQPPTQYLTASRAFALGLRR